MGMGYRMRGFDTFLGQLVYWNSDDIDSGGAGYTGPGPLTGVVVQQRLAEPDPTLSVQAIDVSATADVVGEIIARSGVRLGAPTTGAIVLAGSGSPSGSISATKGSLFVRTDTAEIYQNTDGAMSWSQVGAVGLSVGSVFFGTGIDGALDFDGVSNVVSSAFSVTMTLVPSASVYTLTRDIHASSINVANGVTVKTNGYRIFCTGTLTNNGTIQNNGSNGGDGDPGGGAGGTAGAGAPAGTLAGGTNGGAGALGSGTGSNGATSGAGGASGGSPPNPWTTTQTIASGATSGTTSATAGKDKFQGGGGGGATGGTIFGGGGGGAMNVIGSVTTGLAFNDLMSGFVILPGSGSVRMVYGTGGGGGGTDFVGGSGNNPSGGGGGGGAGGMYVGTKTLDGTGTIRTNGGNGGNGAKAEGVGAAGGGGGGGGGMLTVVYGSIPGSQTIQANAGSPGIGQASGGGRTGGTGASGANGYTNVYQIEV